MLAVPSSVRLVTDVEAFRYVTLLFLLRAGDLALVSVWHPSFLGLLLRALPRYWEALVRDLHDGLLRPPAAVPPEVQAALSRGIRPERRRALELEQLGPGNPHRFWPNLRLVSCWGDGHAALYLRELKELLPGISIQPKGLLATEACVTIPFSGQMPLAIRSHFFEFLEDTGSARLAHELEKGGVYSVAVTTGGGLYRYRLEDRVLCSGSLAATPTLRFLGKEDHVSDLVGEKLREEFVAALLERLFAPRNLSPRFALLAPDRPREGHAGYTLYLEADGPLPKDLSSALEEGLRGQGDYAYAARLGQLRGARVFRVRSGGAVAALRRAHGAGQRLGEIKALALSSRDGWSEVFEGAYADEALPSARA
jgi:hypothetical protein